MKKIYAVILSLCILISGLNLASNESHAATIKLSPSSVVLVKKQRYQLKINNPKRTTIWSSSNSDVAFVNSKGVVTGASKGKATITAKIGTKKYTCKVTVQSPYLSNTSVSLKKGSTKTIYLKGTSKATTWSSSDKSVATVSKSGKITAKKSGTATITAKIGTNKYNCKVTVQGPYLSNTSVSLKKGSTKTIYLKGTSKVATWSSSNKSVATVSKSGKITAKKAGTATITAKIGTNKYTCKVTVSKKQYSREYVKNYYAKKLGSATAVWVYDSNFDIKYNGEKCYLLAYEWNTVTGLQRVTEIYIGSETLTNYGRINY